VFVYCCVIDLIPCYEDFHIIFFAVEDDGILGDFNDIAAGVEFGPCFVDGCNGDNLILIIFCDIDRTIGGWLPLDAMFPVFA